MTYIRPFKPNYGDASDGSPASSTFTVAKQTYQWAEYTLNNGHTITLAESYLPSIFRCRGTLTINGAIAGVGKGNAGAPAFGPASASGSHGRGPGGGKGGVSASTPSRSGGGGGGGYAAPGTNGGLYGTAYYATSVTGDWGKGGEQYESLALVLLGIYGSWCAGSGGGTGNNMNVGTSGKAGNGGGGAIFIGRNIVIGATASIAVNGEAGANSSSGGAPAGGPGGGSGGLVVLLGENISLPGAGTVITALGGAGGLGYHNGSPGGDAYPGGAGAVGRIYAIYLQSITGDIAARSNPAGVALNWAALPISIA